MIPEGVQGTREGRPWARRPTFSGWKPSTSLRGSMASSTRVASTAAGNGSCTRIPCTAGSRFKPTTASRIAAVVALVGIRRRLERIPAFSAARDLFRT